ncbi:MAG: 50S ribosomal protein L10 [Thermoprotei archaeon]|nr:50S ribosomal protein L10 [Thermoprotei archaeon]
MLVARRAKIQPWKTEAVKELKELFTEHPVVGIADLTGMPTAQLQVIRRNLRDKVKFKVAKKTLVIKALEELNVDTSNIEPYLRGTVMLMFSNMNSFKLYKLLESSKIPVEAKPGQVVDKEVVVPEGKTDITPGPMLGVLGKFKIPYEVREGKVYIRKATVIAKPGTTISPELASLLLKLNIKPFEVWLEPLAVYDNGIVIPREALKLDLEAVKRDLGEAFEEAFKLSTEIAYPEVPEAIQLAIVKAEKLAETLAENLAIPMPGLIEASIRRAIAEELLIEIALGEKARELGLEPIIVKPETTAPTTATAPAEEEKEEEKKEEVDISSGLESLFGL